MNRSWRSLLPWMTLFAIAMAFLESAVVVDLRALYYPQGFSFPLVPIDRRIALTELVRELATMVMLLAPGALLSRSGSERFAWFVYCFGVWDIFYYVFLKVVLDWPATWFDPDILFLVPVPWVGPVLAPVLVSVGMIGLGIFMLHAREKGQGSPIQRREWLLLSLSAVTMLYTFIEEPLRHVLLHSGQALSVAASGEGLGQLRDYVPGHFLWSVFSGGCLIGLTGLVIAMRRTAHARVAAEISRGTGTSLKPGGRNHVEHLRLKDGNTLENGR